MKKNLLQRSTVFQEMESNQSRIEVVGRTNTLLRLDDGGIFPVDRAILSERSEYFRFVYLMTWLINT
jgi:hypothetical protein